MHRKIMLSTAAVGLMLASGLAYAQSPAERKEEPKRTEEPANASRHGQGTAQEHRPGRRARAQAKNVLTKDELKANTRKARSRRNR